MSKRSRTLIATAVGVLLLCGALLVVMLIPPATAPETSTDTSEESSAVDPAIVLLDKSKDAKGDAVAEPVTGVVSTITDSEGKQSQIQVSCIAGRFLPSKPTGKPR